MATEIQKQSSETLQTERRLFRESAEQELAGMLYMMGQQYRMEITPEVSALWTLTLIERGRLSGQQIREGFLAWFESDQAKFGPPQPGQIIALVAEQVKNVERLPDPSCPRCSGTGWRQAIDSSTRMAKCHCWAPRPKIEAHPQLPPAEEDKRTIRDVLKCVADKVPGAAADQIGKPVPEEPVSAVLMSPELQEKRRQQMLNDLKAKGINQ